MRSLPSFNKHLGECRYKYQALYQALRQSIEDGHFKRNERLPSIRALARYYQISINTVIEAYSMLGADNYVRTESRRGSFVSYEGVLANTTSLRMYELSERGRRLRLARETPAIASQNQAFPRRKWVSCMFRSAGELDWLLDEKFDGSSPALRERISLFLGKSRDLKVSPDEIVVACGLEQGLFALLQLLAEPGSQVFLETPLRPLFQETLLMAGVALRPWSDDDFAAPRPLCVRSGRYDDRFDFQHALRTLAAVERTEGLLIEVDTGKKKGVRKALKSVASWCVAHLGVLPGLPGHSSQIAYLIPPPGLAGALRKTLSFCGRPPAALLQHTMAEFMRRGFYQRYLSRRSSEVC